MKVYNNLASIYDYFIDWDERLKREDPFYNHLFRECLASSILDVGCGTGGHSIYWAEMGYNVVGIDSATDMIAHAKKRSEEEEVDTEFQCYPMTDFASRLQQKFDAVVCVGNNIAHLLEPAHVKRLFTETIAGMKETGVAIFHLLNYHRILGNKKRDFPARSRIVDDKEYLFLRYYDFFTPLLEFHFVVAIKENGEWSSKSYQLKHYPWLETELIPLAKEAGFTQVMIYGGFDFSDFDPDTSQDLILVCELGEN